jgi:WD40 repeat protein
MALSPDRRIVAVAELTSNSLFAAASGVRIGAVPANHDVFGVTRVAFSPEARAAAVTEPTAGMGAMAIAAPRPQVLWQQKSPAAMAAAFSRAGRLAVAQRAAVQPPDATLTNAHGTVLIDPVPPNEPLLSVAVAPGPGGAVLGVDVASSGNGLITCISADQAARLFAVEDGRLLFERGHPGPLNDLVFLRNGQGFATACSDGQVRLFDTASGEQRWFQQYAGAVNALGRPLSGAFVCTAGSDKTVRCLDAATGTQRWQALFPQSVTRVTVSSDGGFAIAACADRTVRLLRASDGTAGWPTPVPHNAPVRALAVRADGTLVATASQDGIVRVLASDSGSLVRQVSHVQGATSVAFSADGRDVISGSLDGAVLVSAAADPAAPPAQLLRAAAPVQQIKTGPGRSAAVVAQDGLIRLVDLDLRTDLARIYASANVSDIAVDTGRGLIASGADDGTLRVDTWPQP